MIQDSSESLEFPWTKETYRSSFSFQSTNQKLSLYATEAALMMSLIPLWHKLLTLGNGCCASYKSEAKTKQVN